MSSVDPSEVQIRSYRTEDQEAVWSLHNRALDGVDAHPGSGTWDDDLHAITDIYLPEGAFLVATLGDRVCGMGALRRTGPRDALLTRMRVEPRLQGNGVGAQLLEALEQRARELGLTRLRLTTTTHQLAAQALYRGHGYRLTGTGREGSFEVIYLEKELTGGD